VKFSGRSARGRVTVEAVHPLFTLILIFIVVYMGSCVIHPYVRCRACNRSKESLSRTFRGAFGPCRSCKGRGHHLRFGARLIGRKD